MEHLAARAFNLYWGLGREAEARAVLDEALVTTRELGLRQGVVLLKAALHCFSGDLGEGRAGLDRMLAMGPLDEPAMRAATPLMAGIHAFDGRAEKALAIVEQNPLEAFPSYRASMLEFAIQAALLLGDLKAADGHAAEGFRLGEEYGAWNRALVGFGTARARVCRLRGQLDRALRLSREAAARLPPRSQFAGACLAELAMVQALRGDAAAAEDTLSSAAEVTIPVGRHVAFPLRLARVWVLAARGDMAAAVREALDAAAEAAAAGLRAYEVTALHDAVRFGAATVAAPRLAELVEQVDGPLVVLYSRHAAGCAAGDGAALDAVSAEFETLELPVHAAEAAAQAAAAHDQAGRSRPAQAARTRAWTLAQRCQGARTPALVNLLLPDLTGRQREIAGLATAGLTNREIADRLTLSMRTVANHLGAVYERLGINDRAALAEILNYLD
jgi:DNA-binding NarL/FixJ family response regulator